ncbi:MAG TPA: metallophosphoesterase, partial [Methylovirgula sp.]
AGGPATLCGLAVETDAKGLAIKVAPVRIGGRLSQARADFWD